MEIPSLSMIPYILLSQLLFQKLPGAALQQRVLQGMRDVLTCLTPRQIDLSLRLLAQQGLVTELASSDARSDESVYAITPKGEAAVHHWLLHTPITNDESADFTLRRVPWERLVPRQTIIGLLEIQHQQCLEDLAACEAQMLYLSQYLTSSSLDDKAFFPCLALQSRIAEFRANLAWAEQTLARLRHQTSL